MNWLFELIFESLFGKLIKQIFNVVFAVGEGCMLLFIWNQKSREEFKQKSKDSAMPYFIGFAILIGSFYLLF